MRTGSCAFVTRGPATPRNRSHSFQLSKIWELINARFIPNVRSTITGFGGFLASKIIYYATGLSVRMKGEAGGRRCASASILVSRHPGISDNTTQVH